MNAMPPGSYVTGTSPVHRLDARAKLVGLLSVIAGILMVDTAAGWAVAAAVVGTSLAAARLPVVVVRDAVLRVGWFLLFIVILNACFYGQGEPWFEFGVFRPGPAGLGHGAAIAARVVLIVAASTVFVSTTPPLTTVGAINWLIRPLRAVRVPTEQVALILSVAMQFVPTLFAEANSIRLAQTARGAVFHGGGPVGRARAMLPLLIPLVVAAFRRADELATAMESRGYRTDAPRNRRATGRFRLADLGTVAGALVLVAAAFTVG